MQHSYFFKQESDQYETQDSGVCLQQAEAGVWNGQGPSKDMQVMISALGSGPCEPTVKQN